MSEMVQLGRVVFDQEGTRYVELSSEYPRYLNWGGAIERKLVGFDGSDVALTVNDGASERTIVLTKQEFEVLIASYQQYCADEERRQAELRASRSYRDDYDPFGDLP